MNYSIHRLEKDGTVNPDAMAETVSLESAQETAVEIGGKIAIIAEDGSVYDVKGRALEVEIPWLSTEAPAEEPKKSARKPRTKKATEEAGAETEAKPRKTRAKKPKAEEPQVSVSAVDVLEEILAPAKPVEEEAKTDEEEAEIDAEPVKANEKVLPDDYLMWVGNSDNLSIEEFLKTAKRGVAKRISKLSRTMIPHESTMFLAHDEGTPANAVIFGRVTITNIQIAVDNVDSPNLEERYLNDSRIEIVGATEKMPEGIYVIGKKLEVFDQCFDYNAVIGAEGKRFRGYKKVDAMGILNSEAYKERPQARPKASVKLPEGYEMPKEGDPWTEEERGALIDHTKGRSDLSQSFREFSHATGRSYQAVSYQYYRFLRNAKAGK